MILSNLPAGLRNEISAAASCAISSRTLIFLNIEKKYQCFVCCLRGKFFSLKLLTSTYLWFSILPPETE